jgi:hypothetical protein
MARGIDTLPFVVRVTTGVVSDVGAQKKLDEYRAGSGARSIKQAIEADRTLGGACESLQVTGTSGPGIFAREGGGQVIAEDWTVNVLARGG